MASPLERIYHSLFPNTRARRRPVASASRKLTFLLLFDPSLFSPPNADHYFIIHPVLALKLLLPSPRLHSRIELSSGSIISAFHPLCLNMLVSRTLVLITIILTLSCCIPADAGCPKCRRTSDVTLNRSKRKASEANSSYEDDSEEYSAVDLEAVRLEYIKQQILQRLGMSKAPKVERKQVDIAPRELPAAATS